MIGRDEVGLSKVGKPQSISTKGMHVHGAAALKAFLPAGETLVKVLQAAAEVPWAFSLLNALFVGLVLGGVGALLLPELAMKEEPLAGNILGYILGQILGTGLMYLSAKYIEWDGRIHYDRRFGQFVQQLRRKHASARGIVV